MADNWTDDRVELVKTRWTAGVDATQIADELGHGITKNAVIGKVHHLGLAKAPIVSIKTKEAEPKAEPKLKVEPAKPIEDMVFKSVLEGIKSVDDLMAEADAGEPVSVAKGKTMDELPSLEELGLDDATLMAHEATHGIRIVEDVAIPESNRVTMDTLRPGMCKWPSGDPGKNEFSYCGKGVWSPGKPYCAHHHGIAFQAPQKRRAA